MNKKTRAIFLSVFLITMGLSSCKSTTEATAVKPLQVTLFKIGLSDTIKKPNPLIQWTTNVDVPNFGYAILNVAPVTKGLTPERALETGTKLKIHNNSMFQYLAKPIIANNTTYAMQVTMNDKSGGLLGTSNIISEQSSDFWTHAIADFDQMQFSSVILDPTVDDNTGLLTHLNITYSAFPDAANPSYVVSAQIIKVPCCQWYPIDGYQNGDGTWVLPSPQLCQWDEASNRRSALSALDDNGGKLYPIVATGGGNFVANSGESADPFSVNGSTINMHFTSPLDPSNCYVLALAVFDSGLNIIWTSTYYYGIFNHL